MCCPASGEPHPAGAAGGQGDRAAGDCRGALRYQRAGLQGAQEDDRWPSWRLLLNTILTDLHQWCCPAWAPRASGLTSPRCPSMMGWSRGTRPRTWTASWRWVIVSPNDDDINLMSLQVHNKTPVWNDETQSYVLNFHGRVTQVYNKK